NVIGDIKGSQYPEQVIIVSGHLDSWDLGTGAIDDAAGVAVSMEAANLIQKRHLKPKRTIRVIAWMNEENGQAGSKQYWKDREKGTTAASFIIVETWMTTSPKITATPDRKAPFLARAGRWVAELILVFVGVYAAFWLNNYQQHRQDAERRDRILASIEQTLRE